jgi:hypothetical protein
VGLHTSSGAQRERSAFVHSMQRYAGGPEQSSVPDAQRSGWGTIAHPLHASISAHSNAMSGHGAGSTS